MSGCKDQTRALITLWRELLPTADELYQLGDEFEPSLLLAIKLCRQFREHFGLYGPKEDRHASVYSPLKDLWQNSQLNLQELYTRSIKALELTWTAEGPPSSFTVAHIMDLLDLEYISIKRLMPPDRQGLPHRQSGYGVFERDDDLPGEIISFQWELMRELLRMERCDLLSTE